MKAKVVFLLYPCSRECEVFSKMHAAPFSKVITFHKKEPFDLEALYSIPAELPYPDHRIGTAAHCRGRRQFMLLQLMEFQNVKEQGCKMQS